MLQSSGLSVAGVRYVQSMWHVQRRSQQAEQQ